MDCYNANPRAVNKSDLDGYMPLHFVAYYRNYWKVKFLIAKGADINATNKYGSTPIMQATANRWASTRIIQYLLDQGADINIRNHENKSLLDMCKKHMDDVEARGYSDEELAGIIRSLEQASEKGYTEEDNSTIKL